MRRCGIVAALVAVVVDQVTKAWALEALWPPYSDGVTLLPVLNLRLGFNTGVTFGIFAESAALDGMVAPAAVPTLRAMSAIYRGILRRIARDPRSALASRVRLSALEKSWIALRARLGLLGAVP